MENALMQVYGQMQVRQTVEELRQSNGLSGRYGLCLSEGQMQALAWSRLQALQDTGRVEFGRGILSRLVEAFCDSPYLNNENYADTLSELQDAFYYFKNESMDMLDDEQLINFMRQYFDKVCHGSLGHLNGTMLEDLCRRCRSGVWDEDGMETEDAQD